MKEAHEKPQHPTEPGPTSPMEVEELPSYFEEPEPEPRWKRILSNRTFLVVVVLAVVAGTGIAFAPGLYREIKARRALAILAAAEEAMRLGNLDLASEKMRVGFSMSPGDPRVLRILTRFRTEAGDPDSYAMLYGWVADGSATVTERLALAGIAIKRNDPALASRVLDSLPAQLPPALDAGRILARANLLANGGQLAEAARILREASLPADQARRIRLVLGTLLLSTSPDTRAEGWQILESLGNSDTGEGLAALRQMAAHQLSTRQNEWSPDRLIHHPLHTYSDVLLGAQVRIGESGGMREKIVQELIAGAPELEMNNRCSLARWLLASRFPERVRGIFSTADLASSEPAFLVVADALAAQERWEELRAFLNSAQRPQLDEAVRQLLLARVAGQLGDPIATDACWQTVRQNLPFSNPETIRQIADYALKAGHSEIAKQGIELLVERRLATPADFAGLVRMIPPNAPATEALVLMDKFLAAYPQIPEVRSDQAYFSLLAGRNVEACRATADELFRQKPEYLAFLSVLALAELRLGHPAEAARLYDGREIAWKDAPSHFKVIRIAVLSANGLSAEADALRLTLDPLTLRPEEQELIQKREAAKKNGLPAGAIR
ncbi:MAG: hypothetical protein WCO94_04435 [Verrucomicrobiota bacterium]